LYALQFISSKKVILPTRSATDGENHDIAIFSPDYLSLYNIAKEATV
jgi:hypothetical protein